MDLVPFSLMVDQGCYGQTYISLKSLPSGSRVLVLPKHRHNCITAVTTEWIVLLAFRLVSLFRQLINIREVQIVWITDITVGK